MSQLNLNYKKGDRSNGKVNKINPQQLGIREPNRKTMYDIFMENLKFAQIKTFLHRLIYVGTHSFPKEELGINYFSETISKVNDCIEPVTGFLLLYKHHFVHVVEGDENGCYQHVYHVLNSKGSDYLGTIRLLLDLSHIGRRLCKEWSSFASKPKRFLTPLDVDSVGIAETSHYIIKCTIKMYELIMAVEDETPPSRASTCSINTYASISAVTKSSFAQKTYNPYLNYLPEFDLVEFLTKTPHLLTLEKYSKINMVIPQRLSNKDQMWPIPADFIPYNIYDPIYDRRVDMFLDENQQKKKSHDNEPEIANGHD